MFMWMIRLIMIVAGAIAARFVARDAAESQMRGLPMDCSDPFSETDAVGSSRGQLWGVMLAGGEGVRLQPLVRRICGDDRPKRYVPLLEKRTLLRQTLDRVALGIPPARTTVITLRSHRNSWGSGDHFGVAGPQLCAARMSGRSRSGQGSIV